MYRRNQIKNSFIEDWLNGDCHSAFILWQIGKLGTLEAIEIMKSGKNV